MMVTLVPRTLKRWANSTPTAPPPAIMIDLGISSHSKMSSLVSTYFLSCGILSGMSGTEPVANITFFVVILPMSVPFFLIKTLLDDVSCPSPGKRRDNCLKETLPLSL